MQQQMSEADLALFRQAEAFAKSGNMLAAYRLFCLIESHGSSAIEVKFWIIQTTPSLYEASNLLTWLESTVPNHPALLQARIYVATHWHNVAPLPIAIGPTMHCPYCGHVGPTMIDKQIAQAGWIVCVVGLLIGLLLVFLIPCIGILFILLCWLGLLISERRGLCARCRANLVSLP